MKEPASQPASQPASRTGRSFLNLLTCFLLAGLVTCQSQQTPQSKQTTEWFLVTKVRDGDTIILENNTVVRYIGINTPERGKPFYKEATEVNRRLVEGKKVRLEYDVERIEKTDEWKLKRYGEPRTLAYVWLEDGTFVQGYLVENGYAEVKRYPPNVRYHQKFLELQRSAKEKKLGRWKE